MALIDPLSGDFVYVQVADSIGARIEVGEWDHELPEKRKLPAERELAAEYKVAYQTLRHAIKVLRDRGLIVSRQGLGNYIVARHGQGNVTAQPAGI